MEKVGYSKLAVLAVMMVLMMRNEAARVVGGDGVIFHFNGQKDQNYCLLTDTKIQMNAQMIGLSKNERSLAWINGLSIMTEKMNLFVGARKEQSWDVFMDHLEIKLNGTELFIPAPGHKAGPLANPSIYESEDGHVKITRRRINEVNLEIASILELQLSINAVEPELRSESNCFAHLNMEFKKLLPSSPAVHGFLGQTFRPSRLRASRMRSKQNFEESFSVDRAVMGHISGPAIVGEVSDYLTSGLWAPDCQFSKYAVGAKKEQKPLDNVIDIIGQGIMMQRKKIKGFVSDPSEEEVNPLQNYFSEEAVKGMRLSAKISDDEDVSLLSKFEDEETEMPSELKDCFVVAVAAPDTLAGIDHRDSEIVSMLEINEAVMTE